MADTSLYSQSGGTEPPIDYSCLHGASDLESLTIWHVMQMEVACLLPDTNQEAECDVMQLHRHRQSLSHTTHSYWLFWIHLIKAVKLLFLCFPDYLHTNLSIDRMKSPHFCDTIYDQQDQHALSPSAARAGISYQLHNY